MFFTAANNVRFQLDEADADLLTKHPRWSAVVNGNTRYVVARPKKGVTVYLHRLVLNAQPGQLVDHINGDGLDNRRSNLRQADRRLNSINSRTRRDSRSGVKGVEHCGGRWLARIWRGRKPVRLGSFATLQEAEAAYARARAEGI